MAFLQFLSMTAVPAVVQQPSGEQTDSNETFAPFQVIGAHPGSFRVEDKRSGMSAGASTPFIDPGQLGRFVEQSGRMFRAQLAQQQSPR